MWPTLYIIAAAFVLPLFVAQFVCWLSLRFHRMRLARWRKLAMIWFTLGLSYLIAGGLLWVFGPPESQQVASLGISGGVFNALVAAFHMKTVDLVMRPKRRTPPRKDEDSDDQNDTRPS